MIVVDTSALVAIVLGEDELERFAAIMSREPCLVSGASVTEAALVVDARQGPDAVEDLRRLLHQADVEVVPVDEDIAWSAHAAWRRFGKGRHPAGLNVGDCFSYALARSRSVPLLFKGDDFTSTDVDRAR